jgi:PAS domain S-box-containing protein
MKPIPTTKNKRVKQKIASLAKFSSENPGPVLRISRDGIVLYANAASGGLLDLWGCAVGGTAPQFWRDLVAQALASGENKTTDIECAGKVYSIFVAPVAEPGYVNLYGRDITTRKRAEEALRSKQMMLARTEGIAHVGSWEWDIAKDRVTWSDELFRIFQRDPREGAPSFAEHPAFYHPDDMARLQQAVEAAVADGTPYELELRAIRKDGETRVCVARGAAEMALGGRPFGLFGSLQDITERKRTEEALYASEVRFRELFHRMSSGVAVYEAVDNGGDFIFKDFNPAAEEIEKVSRKDILGKRVSEVFPGVKAFGVFEVFQRVWQTGQPEYYPENIYKDERDSGSWRENWIFKLPTGEIVAIYNDITERKRAEEAAQASLREKEVLLREIHHRVKNNMQVISSLFNLQAGKILNPEYRKILKEGQTRLRAMSLVHEKLYQSRDLSKIDLAVYIQSLGIQLFQTYLIDPDQVQLETDFEEVPLDLNSAVPCGLILNELISNSLKHAFPEGRKGLIRIGLKHGPDDTIILQVADNGIGFPKNLDFRQSESLGLEVANLLVGQIEGTIELDRTNGTAFTVTFREMKYAPRI